MERELALEVAVALDLSLELSWNEWILSIVN